MRMTVTHFGASCPSSTPSQRRWAFLKPEAFLGNSLLVLMLLALRLWREKRLQEPQKLVINAIRICSQDCVLTAHWALFVVLLLEANHAANTEMVTTTQTNCISISRFQRWIVRSSRQLTWFEGKVCTDNTDVVIHLRNNQCNLGREDRVYRVKEVLGIARRLVQSQEAPEGWLNPIKNESPQASNAAIKVTNLMYVFSSNISSARMISWRSKSKVPWSCRHSVDILKSSSRSPWLAARLKLRL